MNRVEESRIQIKRSVDTLRILDEDYKGKRKGKIYYTSRDYHTKKIAELYKKILGLSQGSINRWDIIYIKDNIPSAQFLYLDSTITKEEVISYYTLVLGIKKIDIKKVSEFIKTGFPRKL